ncbi:MAG: beta-glucosidase [Kiritimatiellae bacterium]|nr:beta-glucosidase [Kiritimatiellia bacterium]
MSFPEHFVWGAAAASYQIEGSTQGIDGCGESVWDLFCKRPGAVKGGDTGFIACDHYHRYREDVALMKEIGLQAYRLSVMWPRVMPEGTGSVNEQGLDFYDRLIDTLLAADITPWVTLFHWDYPATLFQRGGWLHDDSPMWFEAYAMVVVNRLSDRVRHWFTLNEPACFIALGHQAGVHAPGLQLPAADVNRAWHHAMLAHGRAVRVIRHHSKSPHPLVGAAPVIRTCIPASESAADIEAARRMMFEAQEPSMFEPGWNLGPLFEGAYPDDAMALWGADAPTVRDGDMELIGEKLDFMGLNIYQSGLVKAGPDGAPESIPYRHDHPRTLLGWPVTPDALRWGSKFLYERYRVPVVITENGLALNDWVSLDGKVHDPLRIDFLTRYLQGLEQSIREGIEVLGYFHWSIMDNFEWAEGNAARFGLIHVNYVTQQRTIKDSGYWYRDLIRSHGEIL